MAHAQILREAFAYNRKNLGEHIVKTFAVFVSFLKLLGFCAEIVVRKV